MMDHLYKMGLYSNFILITLFTHDQSDGGPNSHQSGIWLKVNIRKDNYSEQFIFYMWASVMYSDVVHRTSQNHIPNRMGHMPNQV